MALGDPPPSFDDVIYEQHLECMHEAMHIAQKVQQHENKETYTASRERYRIRTLLHIILGRHSEFT